MSEQREPGAVEAAVLVFCSHVIDPSVDDTKEELESVRTAIESEKDFQLWTFEDHPASGAGPTDAWRTGIERSEFVVVLVGADITSAVEAEVDLALEQRRWMLVFVRTGPFERSARANALLERIRKQVTYREFCTPMELKNHLTQALRHNTRDLVRRGLLSTREPALLPPPWRHRTGMTIADAGGYIGDLGLREAEEQDLERRHAAARGALNAGRFSDAMKQYQALIGDPSLAKYPERRAKALNNFSLAARALEKRTEAIAASTEASALRPGDRVFRLTHLGNLVYFRIDGWREAVSGFRDELDADTSGLQLLGAIAVDDGDHVAAIEYCRRVLQDKPDDQSARMNLGHSLAKLGQVDEALTVLASIPADSLYFVPAQVSRAELLYDQAKVSLEPATGLAQAENALLRAEDVAKAQSFDAADWREAKLHSVVCRAGIGLLVGRAADAVTTLKEYEAAMPDRRMFLGNIAQAYAAAGQLEDAVDALEEANRIGPPDPELVNWLAAILMERFNRDRNVSDLKRAEELLIALLKRAPNGIAVLNLSQLFVGSKRMTAAEDLVASARLALPDDIEVKVAGLAIAMSRNDYGETLQLAGAIHAADPNEVTAATVLGVHDFREERYADAILRLRDAISNPFCRTVVHVDTYTFLARALRRSGRLADAIHVALEASRRYPSVPEFARLCEELSSKGVS